MFKKLAYFIFLLVTCIEIFSQSWPADTIHTEINSGNPSFPFPQFIEYNSGKSLAKYNAIGVTHADMEKAMKEGYKIMMHRAIYSGETLNDPISGKSIKYIKYNTSNIPHPGDVPWVSEGDGYALLAAAYMGDKTTFDGLWCSMHDEKKSVVTRYLDCVPLRMNYPYGIGTHGWKKGAVDPAEDAASDGDFDIAMGLFIAYKQWGDNMGVYDKCGKMISYKKELIGFLKTITDTVFFDNNSCSAPTNPNPCNPRLISNGEMGYYTGDIGFDGYVKGGNTQTELTNWGYVNGSNGFFARETYPRFNAFGPPKMVLMDILII